MEEKEESLEEVNNRWKNRRWMAWIAFAGIFAIGASSFLVVVKNANLLDTIVFILAGIVYGYMGFATIEYSKWFKK